MGTFAQPPRRPGRPARSGWHPAQPRSGAPGSPGTPQAPGPPDAPAPVQPLRPGVPGRGTSEEWEGIRRSVAMLSPGAWALRREQALAALGLLVEFLRRYPDEAA